ncbi:hypothetical protein OROGR_016650 [Orobanche gracilis]
MVEASRDSSSGEPRRPGAICFWSDPDPKTLAAAAGAEDGDGSIQRGLFGFRPASRFRRRDVAHWRRSDGSSRSEVY